MRKALRALTTLACVAILSALPAIAQNQPQGQQQGQQQGPPQGGPPGGGPSAAPQTMDLATAKKLVAATEAAGAAASQHLAICVVDTSGDVVILERMDGAGATPVQTSEGKARGVLLFGLPTGAVADAIRNQKQVTATISAPQLGGGNGPITLMRGGLPIVKDGKIVGAIGVGGSSSENDEKYAQAGLDAIAAK